MPREGQAPDLGDRTDRACRRVVQRELPDSGADLVHARQLQLGAVQDQRQGLHQVRWRRRRREQGQEDGGKRRRRWGLAPHLVAPNHSLFRTAAGRKPGRRLFRGGPAGPRRASNPGTFRFTTRLPPGHSLVTRLYGAAATLPRSSIERPKGVPVSRKKIRLAAMLSALALFAALPVAADAAKRTITISGSTSVFPLTTKLARAWIKTKQGKKYAFKVSQGGSNVGVSDVAKGRVSIGASSRDPADSDPGGLVFTRVARDALCVVTHSGNRLTNISRETVEGIFEGNTQAIRTGARSPGPRSTARSASTDACPPRAPTTPSGTSSWLAARPEAAPRATGSARRPPTGSSPRASRATRRESATSPSPSAKG